MGSIDISPPPDRQDSSTIHVSSLHDWSLALHSAHRPFLVHLNADTTWLLQLPYPASVTPPRGRTHFNILLDPWLQGPQSDVAWWFSSQWHVVPASVATIADLNEALREVEGRGGNGTCDESEREEEESGDRSRAGRSLIDAVAISHEFTDHCHRATLQELPKNTPVYASDLAAELIRQWAHFDRVMTLPALGPGVDWKKLNVGPLPSWVALGRIITPGNALYYHAAILVAFDINHREDHPGNIHGNNAWSTRGNDPREPGEAIVYSPHGISAKDLSALRQSHLQTLALLHGMDDVRIWMTKQLNLGALNGIRAVGASGARYWIATHDEEKTGRGFIAPFLLRRKYALKDAVAHEQKKMEEEEEQRRGGEGKAPRYEFRALGSGEGYVLE